MTDQTLKKPPEAINKDKYGPLGGLPVGATTPGWFIEVIDNHIANLHHRINEKTIKSRTTLNERIGMVENTRAFIKVLDNICEHEIPHLTNPQDKTLLQNKVDEAVAIIKRKIVLLKQHGVIHLDENVEDYRLIWNGGF